MESTTVRGILFDSLKTYLDSISIRTGLRIDPCCIALPIGPAGDKYLGIAIKDCLENNEKIVSFTVPCIRKESHISINLGTHLSLFFLMLFVFGSEVDYSAINNIYTGITGVRKISVQEILNQTCKSFKCENFTFIRKAVSSAKQFPFTGYAYEMFDTLGIEIANIALLTQLDQGPPCTVFAFGTERMIMHHQRKTNIWETAPFSSLAYPDISPNIIDRQRRTLFMQNVGMQVTSDKYRKYASTFLV